MGAFCKDRSERQIGMKKVQLKFVAFESCEEGRDRLLIMLMILHSYDMLSRFSVDGVGRDELCTLKDYVSGQAQWWQAQACLALLDGS